MPQKIVVLDFGSQYNQLIVRKIRELGVYSELVPYNIPLNELANDEVIGIILSGGPFAVYEANALKVDEKLFDLEKPVLGVCYGLQLMMQTLGGNVVQASSREFGLTEIMLQQESPLLTDLPVKQMVWMSHGDSVNVLAPDFVALACSDDTPYAIVEHVSKPLYGVQFHPEVSHTVHGHELLANFAFNICRADKTWNMADFANYHIEQIKNRVGDDNVICGLSGGVDSSVVAALLAKAIGKQLTCIFVDHGLLRENEVNLVREAFLSHFDLNLVVVDAKERFLGKLANVFDPEEKRKIIGHEFIEVFKDEARKIKGAKYLAQGTLYTDVIESGTMFAKTIKSHHNVGGLPEELHFELIEPLNTLFKDEVRQLGLKLGLPESLVYRKPFPGPGLAIRVMGEVTEEKLSLVRRSDVILHEELALSHEDEKIWQFFTVLTSNKTVGVMGDNRTYEYTLAIRAVTSIDGMTADFARINYDTLARIANRIVNEVSGINRIVYDITSKPPGTIEWE